MYKKILEGVVVGIVHGFIIIGAAILGVVLFYQAKIALEAMPIWVQIVSGISCCATIIFVIYKLFFIELYSNSK